MHLFGFTLNTVTLLSLALVVGILVDDAIVEIENIERHLRMGKTPYQAAMDAADEIGMAVIATTFALVAVFLPTAFMAGIPGKFFKQFGWTAVLAILASLVVARLLTPMMAAYILKPHKNAAHADPKAAVSTRHPTAGSWRTYMATMRWCLRHRAITMSGRCGVLPGLDLAGAAAADRLRAGGRPRSDPGDRRTAPRQHPGRDARCAAEQARVAAMTLDVKGVFSSIGGGASGDVPSRPAQRRGTPRRCSHVTTSHRNDRHRTPGRISRPRCASKMLGHARRTLHGRPAGLGREDAAGAARATTRSRCRPAAQKVERDLRTCREWATSAPAPPWCAPRSSCAPTSPAPPTSA
jgi:multidrug efflux pump subunit AcrB